MIRSTKLMKSLAMISNFIIGMDVNFSLNNLQYHVIRTALRSSCEQLRQIVREVLRCSQKYSSFAKRRQWWVNNLTKSLTVNGSKLSHNWRSVGC